MTLGSSSDLGLEFKRQVKQDLLPHSPGVIRAQIQSLDTAAYWYGIPLASEDLSESLASRSVEATLSEADKKTFFGVLEASPGMVYLWVRRHYCHRLSMHCECKCRYADDIFLHRSLAGCLARQKPQNPEIRREGSQVCLDVPPVPYHPPHNGCQKCRCC